MADFVTYNKAAGRYEPVSTIGVFRQSFDDHLYVATQLESIYARRVFPSSFASFAFLFVFWWWRPAASTLPSTISVATESPHHCLWAPTTTTTFTTNTATAITFFSSRGRRERAAATAAGPHCCSQ